MKRDIVGLQTQRPLPVQILGRSPCRFTVRHVVTELQQHRPHQHGGIDGRPIDAE
jgi:hypothetical protein